jgi:hypothetical protein
MQDDNTNRFEPADTFYYFRRAIEIIKLNQQTMLQVAGDPNALRFGITVTAIGGALAFIPGKSLAGVFVGALFSVLALFLFSGFVHMFCGYSKGKEEYLGFARVVGLSGVLDWAVIVPLLGTVTTIWSVVIAVVAAQVFYGPLSFLMDIPNQ